MSDLAMVLFTMVIVLYATYFIRENDGDGNARPDKTLFAMEEDKAVVKKRGRFPTPPPPQSPPPGARRS